MASADATMFDDTPRKLWCLIKHDSVPFLVTVSANATIHELKELILKEGIGTSKGILSQDLLLFKVSTFLYFSRHERSKAVAYLAKLSQVDNLDLNENEASFSRLDYTEDAKDVQKLTPWYHVSAIWLDQPLSNRLHVFVKRTATGEGFVVSVYEWRCALLTWQLFTSFPASFSGLSTFPFQFCVRFLCPLIQIRWSHYISILDLVTIY